MDRRLGQQPQLPPSATKLAEARRRIAASRRIAGGRRLQPGVSGGTQRDAAAGTLAARSVGANSEANQFAGRKSVGGQFRHVAGTCQHHVVDQPDGAPGENLLAGGDFEDLQSMLQAGWQHFEHAQPDCAIERRAFADRAVCRPFQFAIAGAADKSRTPRPRSSNPRRCGSPVRRSIWKQETSCAFAAKCG